MPGLNLTEEDIARRLAEAKDTYKPAETGLEAFIGSDILPESPRPAAVLIPLVWIDNAWHILFTRRTDELPEHSGQVAFPGGRADPGDNSPEDTALREAYEEIGLAPERVRILGRLASFLTISNYQVTPVVGRIQWPFPVQLAQVEVSRVFTIPLEWLANRANHEIRQRALPAPYSPIPVIYFQPYDREVLWGVSAYIVLNLLEILVWRKQ